MNKIVKSIIKEMVDADYERFLLRSANGNQIDPKEVYLISRAGDKKGTLALIQSSIKVPETGIFIDIINKSVVSSYDLSDSLEWDPNIKMLSDETEEKTVTLDDIKQIINQIDIGKNKTNKLFK